MALLENVEHRPEHLCAHERTGRRPGRLGIARRLIGLVNIALVCERNLNHYSFVVRIRVPTGFAAAARPPYSADILVIETVVWAWSKYGFSSQCHSILLVGHGRVQILM